MHKTSCAKRDPTNNQIAEINTELLSALRWITRCAKMQGPVGMWAYLIGETTMEQAKAAVAKAEAKLGPGPVGSPFTFTLHRDWEAGTQAQVSGTYAGHRAADRTAPKINELMLEIQAACTDWHEDTTTGQQAWRSSSENFNIGDLSHYLDDADLVNALKLRGITNLQIICDGSDDAHGWSFDSNLMD